MMDVGIFVLGILWGLLGNKIEEQLVKDYDEIILSKGWSIYMMPIITGILWLLLWQTYGVSLETIGYMLFIGLLMILACFDLKYMLLPTKVIYMGIGLCIIYRLLQLAITRESYFIISGGLGALIGYGLFLIIFYGSKWLFKKEGLGFGDVRLMALIGLYVGIEDLFILIIIASILAVLVGVILYLIRRKSEAYPFGPFLCGAAIVMVLFGNKIIAFYLGCLGL